MSIFAEWAGAVATIWLVESVFIVGVAPLGLLVWLIIRADQQR